MKCNTIFFLTLLNLLSQSNFGMEELQKSQNYFKYLNKGTLLLPSNTPHFYFDSNGNVYTYIKVKTFYALPNTIKIMKDDLNIILENGQNTIKTDVAPFEFINNNLTISLPKDPQTAQEIKNHYSNQTPKQINFDHFNNSSSSSESDSSSSLIELSGALLEEFKAKYEALSRSSSSSSLSVVSEFKNNEHTNSSRSSFNYESSSETE